MTAKLKCLVVKKLKERFDIRPKYADILSLVKIGSLVLGYRTH